ncbi:MAG: putative zinc-binding protein [Candidatus Bathyarchaeia archaeon]
MLMENSIEKHKFLGKFVIAPCSGVGQTVGTISRQAAYVVVDKIMPNETLLLCLPAFVIGVEGDVKMVKENPNRVIAIEGCDRKCMSKILERQGTSQRRQLLSSTRLKKWA